MIQRPLVWLAPLLAGLLLCACPRRTPLPDLPDVKPPDRPRVEPKKTDVADRALQEAAATASTASSKQKAAQVYEAVHKAYPETTAGQEALYRAGVLYFEAGDHVSARKAFNTLLYENPLFDKAAEAKRMLGESALEVGAYRDAYQTLWSLAERATGDERRQLLEDAARAAEGALLFGDALKIAILIANEAPSREAQDAAIARVTDLVEGKVPFVDIARIVQDLPPSNPAWPVLTFKLARIYYHLRDWSNLEDTVQRFLASAPGHPFAPQAREMLTRFNNLVNVKPRRVGVILPMTGKYAPLGEAVMRGIKLALGNSDIELVVKDTQGDVTQVAKAVEDLAFEDQAIAILGPMLGDDSRRAALAAEELQIPILTMSRSEGITDLGSYVFRNMLTNSAQARALADYGVKVMGFKQWALLYPDMPYGIELANDFWDNVLSLGGDVRGAETYAFDQTTFTTEAKKLVGRYYLEDRADYLEAQRDIRKGTGDDFRKRKALEKARSSLEPIVDFDAIFIPDEWKRVGLIAPALAVEDIITTACDPRDLERIKKTTGKKDLKTVTLFGSNLWSSPKGRAGVPELIERGGKFVVCSVYVDGFYADSARPATRRFVKAFQEQYKDLGRDPGLLEAIGYDSAAIFRSVLDRARPQNRQEFRQGLSAVKGFEGATGRTTFNERREAEKPLFFLTIDRNGVREIPPNEKVGGS